MVVNTSEYAAKQVLKYTLGVLALVWVSACFSARRPENVQGPAVTRGAAKAPVALTYMGQVKVVGVADGDTIIVRELNGISPFPKRVRLLGIDAPESTQAFGRASKQALLKWVGGKTVSLWINEAEAKDRYGRLLAKLCLAPEPMAGKKCDDINLRQIEQGYAWHFRAFQSSQPISDQKKYEMAERIARGKKVGLWSENKPLAPWNYRLAAKDKIGQKSGSRTFR